MWISGSASTLAHEKVGVTISSDLKITNLFSLEESHPYHLFKLNRTKGAIYATLYVL